MTIRTQLRTWRHPTPQACAPADDCLRGRIMGEIFLGTRRGTGARRAEQAVLAEQLAVSVEGKCRACADGEQARTRKDEHRDADKDQAGAHGNLREAAEDQTDGFRKCRLIAEPGVGASVEDPSGVMVARLVRRGGLPRGLLVRGTLRAGMHVRVVGGLRGNPAAGILDGVDVDDGLLCVHVRLHLALLSWRVKGEGTLTLR